MRKTFIATIALAAMWSVPAMAADMPVKAPPSPPEPVQTWTGFYVGGSVGMIWDRIYGRFVRFPVPIWTTSQSTATIDAHVGVQYQLGNVVLGVEGDYVDVSRDQNLSFDGCEPFANCNGTFFNGRIRDMWTVGGRAGWSMGNWLPYINGGWASARGELGFPGGFPVATIITTPATFHGGYIGAGSDWRFWQNLILGFEYRHYQFGAGTTLPINPISLKPQVDTVSLRLSLLFNGAMFSK
jgi:outer membrane immunogenic protein